jgi:hypothetical protein
MMCALRVQEAVAGSMVCRVEYEYEYDKALYFLNTDASFITKNGNNVTYLLLCAALENQFTNYQVPVRVARSSL